jgi:hypothetical protein
MLNLDRERRAGSVAETLLIVFINVFFLVGVYFTLSRKVARIESRSLPRELEEEMSSIITSFNSTADRNIDLLDDRLERLKPLTARAEKLSEQLEGLVRRAEAMAKMRELMQSGGDTRGVPADASGWAPSQTDASVLAASPSAAARAQSLADKAETPRSAHEAAQVYKNTQNVTAPIKAAGKRSAQDESASSQLRGAAARASEKKAAKKASPRRKKTPAEILREMSEAGEDANEIARVLSISREEVLLKQRLLRPKP